MTDERRIERMAGCSRLGKGMLVGGAVLLAAISLLSMNRCLDPTERDGFRHLEVRSAIMNLKLGLELYATDYNRFPVQAEDLFVQDVSTRSRGMLLKVLRGEYVPTFNRRGHEVVYAQFKMARDRKNGLWQDGDEWVLSDRWGEPYYIILDTNKDDQVANPEYTPGQSASKDAAQSKLSPQPPTLPFSVMIYSSGPDRDPKTWDDNVCSWRPR